MLSKHIWNSLQLKKCASLPVEISYRNNSFFLPEKKITKNANYKVHRYLPKTCEKHRVRGFRKERSDKVHKIELIDFHAPNIQDLSPQEQRIKMKRTGVFPRNNWNEKPMYMSSTATLLDKYIPVEGDGRLSLLSKEGALQRKDKLVSRGRNYRALKKIYAFDEDFQVKNFAMQAQDLYIEALENLGSNKLDELREKTNSKAFKMLTALVEYNQIRWKFIKTLEEPICVSVRTQKLDEKVTGVPGEETFAQITVRIHSQQTLAVYDRFGNHLYGNENVAMDNLEYIVFEKHLSNTMGVWRIHDRILPAWGNTPPPSFRTYKVEPEDEGDSPLEEKDSEEAEEERKDDGLATA